MVTKVFTKVPWKNFFNLSDLNFNLQKVSALGDNKIIESSGIKFMWD